MLYEYYLENVKNGSFTFKGHTHSEKSKKIIGEKSVLAVSGRKYIYKEDVEKRVLTSYTYVKGLGNDLKNLSDFRNIVNAVIADETALLFAKGASVRQSIRNENQEEIYPTKIENKLSDILAVHNALAIKSEERLTRILELKAYMGGAQANSELAQHTLSKEELADLVGN